MFVIPIHCSKTGKTGLNLSWPKRPKLLRGRAKAEEGRRGDRQKLSKMTTWSTRRNKNKKEQTSKQRKAEPPKMGIKTRRDMVRHQKDEGQKSCRTDNETPAEMPENNKLLKIKHQKRNQTAGRDQGIKWRRWRKAEKNNKNRHKMKRLRIEKMAEEQGDQTSKMNRNKNLFSFSWSNHTLNSQNAWKNNPNKATCPNSLSDEQVCETSEEQQEIRRGAEWKKTRSRLARRLGTGPRGFMRCRLLIYVTVFAISRVNVLDLLLLCESRALRFIILNSSHGTHCYVKLLRGRAKKEEGRRGNKHKCNKKASSWTKPKGKKGTGKKQHAKTKWRKMRNKKKMTQY